MKSSTETSDNGFLQSLSTSSLRKLLPKSKHKSSSFRTKPKSNSENTDPNTQLTDSQPLPSVTKQSPPEPIFSKEVTRSDSQKGLPMPPEPDPTVKVVVRIRPVNEHEREGERTVKKLSSDTLSVGDRKFMFDSVLDSSSKQEDIFQLVGVPLVKDALAGYNTSILSYGQTGSGKTYTMWGPPSAMVEGQSTTSHLGIVPRIFQMLFAEIQKEQENFVGKQINYQCRCSFLEIYNEQIGDLLDPTQRNLEIKDDPKNGFYVENLTEEYVTSYEDVTQILIKGLSSRKVGATSINSKSSRSHVVFTCIIESWCKETSSKCFGSSKTSRISLVDLAGMERNKLDDAGILRVREGKNVKKSLSQLGLLVNVLAKGTQIERPKDIPYRSSSLTHMLRESLGGNAKLTVICAISPDSKSNGETLSTLRFGQRAKCISNEPVINEITEDHVNDLSDKIRQLKEELIRAKSDVYNSTGSNNGYFKGRNVRESLNQLRVSLNRSLLLPHIDNDSEEELNIDEHDVRELHLQLDNLHKNSEMDLMSEPDISCQEEGETGEINLEIPQKELPHNNMATTMDNPMDVPSRTMNPASRSSLSISSCRQSPFLQDPTLSESPRIGNSLRKSIIFSSSSLASQNNASNSFKLNSDVLHQSLKQSDQIRSSLQSSKVIPGTTESLAASLQRGLQIIDYHQRNSASNKSSVAFSFEHLALKPCPEVEKVDASVQKFPEEKPSLDAPSATFLCTSCRRTGFDGSDEVQDSLKRWIVAADESGNSNGLANPVYKVSMKRQKELENVCMEQAAKIEQLNRLSSTTKYSQESNTLHLEAGNKEIIALGEIKNEEYKLLKFHCDENHELEIIKEIKEVQEETKRECRNTSFDMNEKEALLKEIQSLRNKLESDASAKMSTEKLRSSLLSRSIQLQKSVDSHNNSEEELERERQRWTEMESDWISLTDELRIDIESHRRRAEKMEMELRLEKKCTEELDDALHRAVLGHARFVEHYADLQDKHNELAEKHRNIMEGIAEVKRAAAKAGAKGNGSRFHKYLAAELSTLRREKEREREHLIKENKSLKLQLRDTAEAVHAAGELLVRLREAEEAASVSEDNYNMVQQENERLKKQMEKLKRKHKMEMVTMKQYLAESRLPQSAILSREDSDIAENNMISTPDDDQAWRAEFGAIYQEHY
ncbi:unnamed protein product, partial [Vitis vinifera]